MRQRQPLRRQAEEISGSTTLRTAYVSSLAPLIDNRYRIKGTLGEGAVSLVHRAEDQITGEEVALKIGKSEVHPDYLFHIFTNEIEALSLVDHPNVPELKGAGLNCRLPYVATEIADGRSLYEWLNHNFRGLHCLAGTLKVFSDACDAAATIHAKGIVHRDLGGHNVMVDYNLAVKIIDFGYAKIPGVPDYAMEVDVPVGTLVYFAPEQTHVHANVDHRVDIYALGVSLYMELVGNVPFDVPPDIAHECFLELHRNAPIVPLRQRDPEMPRDVEEIVQAALEKDPKNRFQSAFEMKAALDAAHQNL